MTRLKTVCLSLLVCLCMSAQYAYAQSACVSSINLTVDRDCNFVISPEALRASGSAENAQSIVYAGTGSGTAFTNGQATGSIKDLGIPYGGTIQYQLFSSADGTGEMLCWGDINFEIKSVPAPVTNTITVMCSQPVRGLPTISDVIGDIEGLCVAPIIDIVETEVVVGESCKNQMTIRTITGTVVYGDVKIPTPLRIDTIIETPLTVDMVVGPKGGPDKLDAIILHCDSIDNAYPTPEVILEFAEEGILGAYPYIPKGLVMDTTITPRVIKVDSVYEDMIKVTDDSGTEFWVLSDVVAKVDSTVLDTVIVTTDVVVSLKEGPTCNLSAKYTDDAFPGCVGPDSKIRRTWNILDWCTGEIDTSVQWIIIETGGPVIEEIEDVFVGIAPWTCSASYKLSADIDQGCSETLQVEYNTDIGVIEDNKLLTGLWLGEVATVTVTAIDDCGQRTTETFTVTPFDSIAPVAIAVDQLNVSLTGDPLVEETDEDRGVGKVYVESIDAGSHNAGCGEVDKCLLLKEELEDPVMIGGVHASVDGELIYYAKGCLVDGVIPGRPATKNDPAIPEIHYVVCKEYVKFCCESLGQNSVAMVVTNGGDRQARTWTNVLVEDKSAPIVICPQPFTVGCEEEYEIPRPTIFNGVCSIDVLEMSMTEDFDNCGDGTKTVVWTRDGDIICTTVITVDGTSGFNPYEIKWPKHYNSDVVSGIRRECELLVNDDGIAILDDDDNEQYVTVEYSEDIPMGEPFECTDGGATGEPVWCNNSCGLVGVNFEDQSIEAIQACRKIIRKWTIIDWCAWDPNTSDKDADNDLSDSFTAVNDEWLGEGDWLTSSKDTKGKACAECDKPAGQSDDIYFRYENVDRDGYYTYDQVIKILDFDEPTVSAPDTIRLSIFGGAGAKGETFEDCVASDVIGATVTDMCGANELDASGTGWFVQVFRLDDGEEVLLKTNEVFGSETTMNTQLGQAGDVHLIKWVARDGCGNIGRADTYVLFVEDKKPTPLCIQTLSTSTMNTDGTAVIWASDFDAGSFDNCSEVDLAFKDDEGNFVPSKTISCDELANGVSDMFDIELYAIDGLGNFDFCNVTLRVDDFNDNCPNSTRADDEGENQVSGTVATAFGDMVEDVEISLNVGLQDMTSVSGDYAFKDLSYSSFDISAEKNDDYLNGVTALDVVLIQRHLLGLSKFDNPYNIIAGDINGDGRLSSLDLVDLRRLILGVYDELPNNDSWRFVDAAQKFENPLTPFPFTEVIAIDDYTGFALGQNFLAVKIGDVNGNAIANSLLSAGSRSVGMLAFQVEDRQLSAGDEVEIAITSADFSDIVAYQYTMELDGLEFLSAESGAIEVSESNFGQLDPNTVTTSWYSPVGVSTSEELYTITFRATKDVSLSGALSISSRVTPALAYNADQDLLDVGVEYNNIDAPSEFVLMQNVPNPFDQSTMIGFELPEAGTTTLSVFDVTGKNILTRNASFNAGYQEIILNRSDLGVGGVLYYQLEYEAASGLGSYAEIRKMIVIN